MLINPDRRLWIFYFLFLIWLETVLRVATVGHVVTEAMFLVPLFSIPLASFFTWVGTWTNRRRLKLLVATSISLLLIVYFGSQIVYYQIFKTFYTTYSFLKMGQGLAFLDTTLSAIAQSAFPLASLALPLVMAQMFSRKLLPPQAILETQRSRSVHVKWENLVLFSVAAHIAALSLLGFSGDAPSAAYTQYYGQTIPNYAVSSLGVLTYTRLDIQSHFLPSRMELDFEIFSEDSSKAKENKDTVAINLSKNGTTTYPGEKVADKASNKGINTKNSPSSNHISDQSPENGDVQTNSQPSENKQIATEIKLQILSSLNLEDAIASETNPVVQNLHKYFASRKPSYTNAYTGKYRGYNLILITAEGFSHLAIHKDLTPTLYKLATDGIRFHNFYTPIWGVSTSDGEYVALQSLIPKAGVWSMANSSQNLLPQTLGNQFKSLGYKTVAYHNHYFNYYSRDLSHPNLGYDYKGLGAGLVVKETWPESDLEMMEVTASEYMGGTPFHAYYMTVSGHLGYSFGGNQMSAKNRHLVDHLPISEEAKAYYACQIELDRAVEHLISELRTRELLDKTLIAISADHYPYGLDYQTMCELAGHEIETEFELYKNAFLLYCPGMKPMDVERYCSSFDILPTLSNLMGLEYDSRLMMGRDVFSDDEVLIPFISRSFITDRGVYYASTGTFVPHTPNNRLEETEPGYNEQEYVKRKRAEVEAMFYVSEKILETNYFKLLYQP